MERIKYDFLGTTQYATIKNGETPIQALKRSIERKPGVGYVSTSEKAKLVDRSESVIGHEYFVTICGKKSNANGWPVLQEFKINLFLSQ